jgi:hypothetical protein
MSYPQLDEADFYGRVYHDGRFYTKTVVEHNRHSREGGTFALMEQQQQLPLFLSPETGIRTQLLYHGTGTGKTGTIALCALRFAIVSSKPILFLVPNEIVKLEVESEILGREWTTTADKAKSVFIRKFMGDAFITEQMRATLNSLETERSKDILCRKIWDEHVSRYFELETHTKFENRILGEPQTGFSTSRSARLAMSNASISDQFDGRGVIVDEAHYMRKEKRLYQALMKVIVSCRLSTLFLLTATPMIESADEICPLINLMLAVERVSPARYLTHEIVNAYLTYEDRLAEEMLRQSFRGRISYVRGLDPRSFPQRIDCGIRIFPTLPEHYVWPCYMEGPQLDAYLNAFMQEFDPNGEAGQRNDLWSKTREIARCYTHKDMGRWIVVPTKKTKRWKGNEKCQDWKYARMRGLSTKMRHMYEIITENNKRKQTGPALIYSSNIETGVKRHELFFNCNSFYPWIEGQNAHPFRTHVDISGDVGFCRAKDAIKVLKSDRNYLGEMLKIVIASPKIRTGVTLRHFSTLFLDEVDWTVGDREQIVGRLIRHGSHEHSSDPYCNKSVHVYVLCSRMRPADIRSALNPVALKRLEKWMLQHEDALRVRGFLDENSNLYTVDERTLRVALERDRDIAKITRLMKEMMLPLNLSQNYFPEEGQQFRGKRIYEYQDEPATIPIPSDRYPSKCSAVPAIPERIDDTYLTLDGWFRYVCEGEENNLDLCGNIRRAILEALAERKYWPVNLLLDHVSKEVHVTELEAALVIKNLASLQMIRVELSTGWIYSYNNPSAKNEVDTAFDPIYEWQQEMQNDSPYLPLAPITNLQSILQETDYVNVDDVFGLFNKKTSHIPIGKSIAAYCVVLSPSADSTVYDIQRTAPFCGLYDNTSDNPDEYQLKILTVKPDGKGTNKVSAHSKHDVDGLIGLVTEIDGDTGAVMESSHKKKAACDELSLRLEQTGRLMPWDTEIEPTLLRTLCIARVWGLTDVIVTLDKMAKELVTPLEGLCVKLILGKRKIVLGGPADNDIARIVHEQMAEHITTKKDYVLRVLDRFGNKRPRNLTPDQFATALTWYAVHVTACYGDELKNIRRALHLAMADRCSSIVEGRMEKQKGLKKKNKL